MAAVLTPFPTTEPARAYRLLVVHPGASYSTHDVAAGLVRALGAAGHDVGAYALQHRITVASHWLDWMAARASERDPSLPALGEQERLNRIFDEAAKDVLAMALDNGVDAVLIVSCMFVPAQTLLRLRRAGITVGVVLTESPYDDERHLHLAPLADILWTNERSSVAVLRGANPQVHYLAAAHDPATHIAGPQPGDGDVPAHDVVFVGTGFRERLDLLAAVDWTGIDLGLYGNWQEDVGGYPDDHPTRAAVEPHVRGGLTDNRRAAALYRRATVGLNLYRTSIDFAGDRHVVGAESLNPRAYELAACGVYQVCNRRREVDDVFGGSVPTFETAAELEALIRFALRDDGGRRALAEMSRDRAAAHTFDARAATLMRQFAPVIERGKEARRW